MGMLQDADDIVKREIEKKKVEEEAKEAGRKEAEEEAKVAEEREREKKEEGFI